MTLLYEGQVLALQSVEQIQQLHRLLEVERVVPAESFPLLQSEDGLGWTGGEEEAGLVVTGERRVMAGCRGEATTTAVARASLLLLACTCTGVRVC